MSLCSTPIVSSINPNECIGFSLGKINNNFYNLQESICDLSGNTIHEIDSQEIDMHWDPTTRILSATLQPGAEIPNSKLAKIDPFTVKGNPTQTQASPTDIYAPSCTILGRYDTTSPVLSFAKLVNCQIADRTIETGKIKQNDLLNDVFADDQVNNRVLSAMPPYSVKGNATGTIGIDPQDIQASSDTALIRTGTSPLSFAQASADSVLMRDQTTLRFVKATDWSAYVKPNDIAPLTFTPASTDSALLRSGTGNVKFNAANQNSLLLRDNLDLRFVAANQNSLLLRDNLDLRFVDTPINTVIARDETTLRPISAWPYSAFIRPGLSDTLVSDRLQFRVAEPNSALIRTNTQNLSFAFAPENSALLRMKNDHLRHVVAPSNTALVMTKGKNSGSTGVESLSFIPAPLGTVLRRKHANLTDESATPGNQAVDFGKISYDMFDWNSGPVGVGTVCMFYPTISGTTVFDYFDPNGLGKQDTVYEGWAICNGNTYEFGIKVEDGSTKIKKFVTPDLRCRFVLSTSWNGNYYSLTNRPSAGNMGGEEQHTLTIPEMPVHKHGITDSGHQHTYRGGKEAKADSQWGDDSKSDDNGRGKEYQTGSSKTGITINNTGGGLSHNNMPPYYTLFYIIKLYSGKIANGEITSGASGAAPTPTPSPTPTPTPTPLPVPGWNAIWKDFDASSVTYADFNIATNSTIGLELLDYRGLWVNNGTPNTQGTFTTFNATGGFVGGTLTLSTMTGLTDLTVNTQNLTAIEVPTTIQKLNCSGNKITNLIPAGFANLLQLQELNVSYNKIVSLNLASNSSLQTLACNDNTTLTNLTIPNSISTLDCSNCNLTNLSLLNKTNLTTAACEYNPAPITIDITGCNSLTEFSVAGSRIQTITTNTSTFSNLRIVDASNTTWNSATSATIIGSFFNGVQLNPPGTGPKKLSFPNNIRWSVIGGVGASTRYNALTSANWVVSPLYS